MRKLLQDRKALYLVLTIVVVSVFSLSIAYAAMSAVLEIHGNSEVVASTWDIHLDNVKVKSGSVLANDPQISGTSTLSFDVDLNIPGEFYEFTVDVVNDGSIDAMIDSVVKTPELTTEQVKYIKYEITYENGESISTTQTLKKGTNTPIKVRVEYRKDIAPSELPSNATELSLKLTLVYVQSDGTGSNIPNNGMEKVVNVVSGDGTQVGDEVCIKEECFYVISSDDTSVTMLAKYNLHVGNICTGTAESQRSLLENPTGMQDEDAKGYTLGEWPSIGTTATTTTYSNSIVKEYVDNYKNALETNFGIVVENATLITKNQLISLGCSEEEENCSGAPEWVYATTYWTRTKDGNNWVWVVYRYKSTFASAAINAEYFSGVRPVITISRDYL